MLGFLGGLGVLGGSIGYYLAILGALAANLRVL
jgi:hypothetical protein